MNGIQNVSLSLVAACLLGLAMAGCELAASPAETQAAIARAQAAGDKSVAQARQAATDSTSGAQKDASKANDELAHQSAQGDHRVSVAEADADYKVGIEKCKVLSDEQRVACNKQVDANVAAAKADATATVLATDPKP